MTTASGGDSPRSPTASGGDSPRWRDVAGARSSAQGAAAEASVQARRATRQLIQSDLPAFDAAAIDDELRTALAELLLTMADDEFVIGFRDSEWTGIAPMLEEDVAFSSLAQDEIGHARLLYEMRGALTGEDPDRLAFHRAAEEFRHARLLDHPRTDWAFTICRRWLYDTADSFRLAALADSSFAPLADVVAKIRREERYHLMHLDKWLRRLAAHDGTPRDHLSDSLGALAPDVLTVFSPLAGEPVLISNGVLGAPFAELAARWRSEVNGILGSLGLTTFAVTEPPADGRDHAQPNESFMWLWNEFTSVARLEEGAEW
jgi:ring-1,2-phenylacetyl-CoA epoxidase subunit PaaC